MRISWTTLCSQDHRQRPSLRNDTCFPRNEEYNAATQLLHDFEWGGVRYLEVRPVPCTFSSHCCSLLLIAQNYIEIHYIAYRKPTISMVIVHIR